MKKILIIAAVLVTIFLVIPEDSKADITYHTKMENYNAGLAKFLINTKVGRKLAYIFIKKSTKKKIKQAEKKAGKLIKQAKKGL